MIGELNTFIQYLAALYFTICIDGAFFRRFWSPDYYGLVTEIISQYKFQQSKTLKTKLNDAIKEHADKIEDHSVKRGVFMLLFTLFYLIFIAFEPKCQTELDKVKEWLPLLISSFYVVAIMLMSGFSLKKWRWVVIHIIVYVAIYAIMHGIDLVNENNIQYFGFARWLKIYLVILLLFPIIYQIYINWLYSQAYVQHLISTLNNEYEKYLKTNKAINDRDKKLADDGYMKVFSDSYFENNGQDVVVTKFNQAVLDRLIEACKPPVPYVLIKKWISIKFDKNNIEQIRKIESKYQFSGAEVIPQNCKETDPFDNPLYNKLIDEYSKQTGKSLVKFCKEKGVDLVPFKEYRKLKLKSK